MRHGEWCHFSERLPRSRDHRMVKEADLPFEDEPYAYLAFGRRTAEIRPRARIVSRVRVSKVEASCQICGQDGKLAMRTAPRRAREDYAGLRRKAWGDELLAAGEGPPANGE
jgi:ribosomal protein RSM22 (predicted rRNA methylase)